MGAKVWSGSSDGCGTSFSVVDSSTGQEGWGTCYDETISVECDGKGADLDVDVEHASSVCESRDITNQCPGKYGYRLVSYGCSGTGAS
jgi:hypothetical protein